jgi:CheY-like chemotaxis protein
VNLVTSAMIVPAQAAKEAEERKEGAGKKVLIIDDEPDIRMFLKNVFTEKGYDVIEAADANQGMRMMRDEKPDLVTLDLIMPKKTGMKLYWELKREAEMVDFARTPIVIITGYAKDSAQHQNFDEFLAEKDLPKPEGFLEKPIDPDKVLSVVREILAKAAA